MPCRIRTVALVAILLSSIKKTALLSNLTWLRGPDLNRRPSGYEPDELPLLHPAMLNHIVDLKWSQRWDSNPQPTDYKSVALPIELRRHLICNLYLNHSHHQALI